MSKETKRRKRKQAMLVRVPGWYYALLAGIALVGSMLIVYSMRNPTSNAAAITEEGDFPRGSADAPVTIIEWGSFS